MKRAEVRAMLARIIAQRTGLSESEVTEDTVIPDYRTLQEFSSGLTYVPNQTKVKDVLSQLVLEP